MSGPSPSSETTRSDSAVTDRGFLEFDDDSTSRMQCELCQSQSVINRKYGMAVCRACDQEYLP